MYKKRSIKFLVYFSILLILVSFIPIQLFFYSTIHKQNIAYTEKLFDYIANHTNNQIQELNKDITEITFELSVNSTIQKNIYEYSPSELIKNAAFSHEVLSEYKSRNSNICNLSIVKDGSILLSSSDISFYDQIHTILKKIESKNIDYGYFHSPFIINERTYFTYVIPAYPTSRQHFHKRNQKTFAFCIYEINEPISDILNDVDKHNILVKITDENNTVLLSPNTDEIGKKAVPISDKFFSHTFKLRENDWTLSVYLEKETISYLSKSSSFLLLCMLIISFLILLATTHMFNGVIIKRVSLLKKKINLSPVETVDNIVYEYDDEFGEIVTVFNELLKKIKMLNEEKLIINENLFNAQLLQKETRLFYLHSQMSPHFLYNSMACIHGAAYKYNATDVIELTNSLSTVFRYFSNNKNFSTIKEDLDFAIEYFNIINSRRITPIKLSYSIDESLYNIRCLKMIYQPILENTLKHAFSPGSDGQVTITSTLNDKYAIIEIRDNGNGFSDEFLSSFNKINSNCELNSIHNFDSVGIMNVHMRLKLFYDESCGLTIHSEKGIGSCVKIIFNKVLPEKPSFFENK